MQFVYLYGLMNKRREAQCLMKSRVCASSKMKENALILYSRFFYEKPVFQSVWSYDDRIYFPGDK